MTKAAKRSHHRAKKINVGDTVGLTIAIVDKDRQIVDHKVVAIGVVKRIYQLRVGAWLRADVKPKDKVKWFLYSGKDNWAWVNELTLVKRAPKKRREAP